jgi:hypothetical protein
VAIDGEENVVVVDVSNHRVQQIEADLVLPGLAVPEGCTAADDLLRMLAPGKLTGVSFFVEGQLILAHEKMLCARPEHFDTMLDSQRQTMKTRKAGQGQGQGQPLPVGDTAAAAFRAKRFFLGSLCTQWNEPLQAGSCLLIDDATGARAWSAPRQRCGAAAVRCGLRL